MGTRKPDGYGFGQNFKPVMGTGFLMGVNIFHGYGFGIAKPGGFVPVAISTHDPAAPAWRDGQYGQKWAGSNGGGRRAGAAVTSSAKLTSHPGAAREPSLTA